MGMPAIEKEGIIIVPLTEEQVTDYLDELYSTEERELQIIQKASIHVRKSLKLMYQSFQI